MSDKMKKILILILFILFSVPAFSQRIYQYGITAEIFENNTVSYKLTLIFVNSSNQTFTIPIGFPNNINMNSDTDCKVQSGTLETSIVCNIVSPNKTTVVVTYDSSQKVEKNKYYLFTDSFRINSDTDSIPILIKLPEGTGLREPIEGSYSPENALIGSDGRRTIVNWQMNNLKKGDRIDISIAYERIGEVVISEVPLQIIAMIIVLIAVSVGVFYQFYWKNKNIKLILPILKKDEKKIFDTITKHGSGVNQKIIVNDSGYSKAKVSKVLKSLEERGVLKLERIGRKNKVHIDKKFLNKS
jgi:uncharacterized membrane protein